MQDPHTIPGIDPQMADAMLKGRELTPSGPLDPTSASIEDVRAQYLKGRAYWNEEGPQPHKITNHTVAGPHGPIPVRFYYPTDTANAPLILFYMAADIPWAVSKVMTASAVGWPNNPGLSSPPSIIIWLQNTNFLRKLKKPSPCLIGRARLQKGWELTQPASAWAATLPALRSRSARH